MFWMMGVLLYSADELKWMDPDITKNQLSNFNKVKNEFV